MPNERINIRPALSPIIEWDRTKLERFRKSYVEAAEGESQGGSCVFEFDGHEFLTDYAKYLIQFLDGQFGNTKT
jgi:hypothetical protein